MIWNVAKIRAFLVEMLGTSKESQLTVKYPWQIKHQNIVKRVWIVVLQRTNDILGILHVYVAESGVGQLKYDRNVIVVGFANYSFQPVQEHSFHFV